MSRRSKNWNLCVFLTSEFRSRIRNETVPNITDLRNEVSQTRGALWALCHLGDAAVPNPGEVFNCSEAWDVGPMVNFDKEEVFPHQTALFLSDVEGSYFLLRSCCHPTTCRWGGFVVGLFQVFGRCHCQC